MSLRSMFNVLQRLPLWGSCHRKVTERAVRFTLSVKTFGFATSPTGRGCLRDVEAPPPAFFQQHRLHVVGEGLRALPKSVSDNIRPYKTTVTTAQQMLGMRRVKQSEHPIAPCLSRRGRGVYPRVILYILSWTSKKGCRRRQDSVAYFAVVTTAGASPCPTLC